MFKFHFRVSAKLAIASGVGLLLVAAMLANEQVSNDAVAKAYAHALRQQEVVKNASAGTTAIRDAQIALRDIRLALTPDQAEQDLARLRAAAGDGRSRMEAARQLSEDAASQERMDKVAGLFDQYASRSGELAGYRSEVLRLQAKQNDASARWSRGWEGMEAAIAFAKFANKDELDSNLREGAQLFMDARNTYWRFVNADDPKLAQRRRCGQHELGHALCDLGIVGIDETPVGVARVHEQLRALA